MRKEKKEKNSEEQQKPNTEAEVYDNNKKCDWGKRKKKFKSLIGFLSANKINNYNGAGEGRRKKFKRIYRTSQKIRLNNKSFSWVTAARVLSRAGNHSAPHLARMPSNTILISGPAVGTA